MIDRVFVPQSSSLSRRAEPRLNPCDEPSGTELCITSSQRMPYQRDPEPKTLKLQTLDALNALNPHRNTREANQPSNTKQNDHSNTTPTPPPGMAVVAPCPSSTRPPPAPAAQHGSLRCPWPQLVLGAATGATASARRPLVATGARRKKLKEREAKEASGGSSGGGSVDGAFLGEEGDEWAEPRFQATESEVSFEDPVTAGGMSRTFASSAQDPVPLERPALYVVSVPIGNLGDITLRALRVLREVDAIFAEDTRTTDTLLRRLGIEGRRLFPCHAFNEEIERAGQEIIRRLQEEQALALVSDAGTPSLADPGFAVLRSLRRELGDIPVRPVPGANAAACALSVSGLPASCYLFGGFLPSKPAARRSQLKQLLRQASSGLSATLVVFEVPHRIVNTMEMLVELLAEEGDPSRAVVLARELTKRHETLLSGTAEEVLAEVRETPDNQRGEFVLLLGPGAEETLEVESAVPEAKEVVRLLSTEVPTSRAIALAAKICGVPKKALFDALHPKR
eukprot:s2160_g5.t1